MTVIRSSRGKSLFLASREYLGRCLRCRVSVIGKSMPSCGWGEKFIMSPTRVGPLTVLFVVFAVPCVLGDGVIRDGLGALSIGRGGTNIASADNGEILLDNPAGMANVEGSGLVDLGVDVLFTDLQYANPQNPTANAW